MNSLLSRSTKPTRPRVQPRASVVASLLLSLLLSACGGAPGTPPAGSGIVRIEVTPAALLLTHDGDEAVLSAVAYDAKGRRVDTTFTWTSNRPDDVTVAEGVVGSRTAAGSAQVTAHAAGVTSTPVLVMAATPAPGAVLVRDDEILGDPVLLSTSNGEIVGARIEVLLADVAGLAEGSILLAREGASLAGRILRVGHEGAARRVEYEIVPIDELFDAFRIQETFELEPDASGLSVREHATIAHDTEGFTMTYAPPTGTTLAATPFRCTGKAEPKTKLQAFSVTMKMPTLTATIDGSKNAGGGIETMTVIIDGTTSVEVKGGMMLEAGLKGEAVCTLKLYSQLLPVTGALSGVMAPALELAAEVRLEGEVRAATLELGASGTVGVQVKNGFTYRRTASAAGPAGFEPVLSATPIFDVAPMYKVPSLDDLRVEIGVYVGPVLTLQARAVTIGNQSLLSVDLLEGRLGLRGDVSLSHVRPQITDAGYASAYDVKIRGEIAPGEGTKRMLAVLGMDESWFDVGKLTLDFPPFASSPTGTLSLSSPQANPGDEVTLTVDLKDVTFPLVGDNVARVTLYLLEGDKPPALFATIAPLASNQTRYTHTFTVPGRWSGEYRFAAAVETFLAPFLPLEIAKDSRQTLLVGGTCTPWPTGPEFPTFDEPLPPEMPQLTGLWCDWQGSAKAEVFAGVGSWLERSFAQVRWEPNPDAAVGGSAHYRVHSGSLVWRRTLESGDCRAVAERTVDLGPEDGSLSVYGYANGSVRYQVTGFKTLEAVSMTFTCPDSSFEIPLGAVDVHWVGSAEADGVTDDGRTIDARETIGATTYDYRFTRP